MAARLISSTGDVYEFTVFPVSLGRTEDNEVTLDSRKVSRHHAVIFYQEGQFYLRDLSSKNGTWVKNIRVTADMVLNSGDKIRFGDLGFIFEIPALDDYTETATLLTDTLLKPEPAALPLQIDLEAMQVKLNGRLLSPPLSPLEWKLLVLLYQQQGKVCSRDMIFEDLYQAPDMTDIPLDTALETLVSRLRKRLEMTNPNQLPYIRAVRGAGYRLEM